MKKCNGVITGELTANCGMGQICCKECQDQCVMACKITNCQYEVEIDEDCKNCPVGSDCGQCPTAWGVKGVDWN